MRKKLSNFQNFRLIKKEKYYEKKFIQIKIDLF